MNHGAARALFQSGQKPEEMFFRADGVGFDAAVTQISDVAAEAKALGFSLREKTEADTLHSAGDEEAGCLFCDVHKRRNCSERAGGCQVGAERRFVE